SRQQRGVHRACRAAGVVDVDRVDANQCGLPLDQPVGGGSGEEGVLGAVTVGAPVTVPAGVGTPPVLGRGSRRAHGTSAPSHGPRGRVPAGPGGGLDTVGGVFQAPPRRFEADAVDFADETCRCHWAGRLVLVGFTGAVLAGSGSSRRGAAGQRAGVRTGRGTPGWRGAGRGRLRGRTRGARRRRGGRGCRRGPARCPRGGGRRGGGPGRGGQPLGGNRSSA